MRPNLLSQVTRIARGSLLAAAAVALATTLTAPAFAEEVIYFKSGRSMPIASHRIDDGMIYVDLGEDRTLAFPEMVVERIEAAGSNVALKQSLNPYGKRRVPNPDGSYPVSSSRKKRTREVIPVHEPNATPVEIDPKSGLATYRPAGKAEGANKRRLQVAGNTRAMSGQVQRGGGGRYAGTTTFGSRHVIGDITPRRSNQQQNPKRPPLVGLSLGKPVTPSGSQSAGASTGKGGAATPPPAPQPSSDSTGSSRGAGNN